jgi:hypothetical protein
VSEQKTEGTSLTAALFGVVFFAMGPTIIAGAESDGITLAFWRVALASTFFAVLMVARCEFTMAALTTSRPWRSPPCPPTSHNLANTTAATIEASSATATAISNNADSG